MEQRKAVKINTSALDRLNEQTGTRTHAVIPCAANRFEIYYGDFVEIVLFTQASLLSRMELLLKIFCAAWKTLFHRHGHHFVQTMSRSNCHLPSQYCGSVIKIINMNQNTSMHTTMREITDAYSRILQLRHDTNTHTRCISKRTSYKYWSAKHVNRIRFEYEKLAFNTNAVKKLQVCL